MSARFIRFLQPDAIWTAMIASAAVAFFNYQVSTILLFGLSYWFLTRKQDFWLRWANLSLFTAVGYHAAHRYDWAKVEDWAVGVLLPVLILLALMRLVTRPPFGETAGSALGRLLGKAGLHWLPFSIAAGTLVTLLVGDWFAIYGGAALILAILMFVEERIRLRSGTVMLLVHVLITELMIRRGIVNLKADTVPFVTAQWDQFAAPFLILIVIFLTGRTVRNES